MWLRRMVLTLSVCCTGVITIPVHAQMMYDPSTDPNLAFARGLDAQMEGLNRALGDIDKCSRDDQKACARAQAYDRQQKRMIGILGGMNAEAEIRAGVARDQQRLMDRNTASQYRQDAQGYFGYADQARRSGNSEAAQSWQEKGNSALDWSYRYSR